MGSPHDVSDVPIQAGKMKGLEGAADMDADALRLAQMGESDDAERYPCLGNLY